MNRNVHFLQGTQSSESQVLLASLTAPQARPFLSTFRSPLGGQGFPDKGRERAESRDLPASFRKHSADPHYPQPPAGCRVCPPSWLPGKQCRWLPVPSAGQVGVQWVLGLQMGSLRPARGWALPTIVITEKVSEARILVVLSVTGSFYGSGPAPACPIPGASPHRGVVAAVQAPVYFVCNYLTRKPGSCYEQVSANRPMSLPRDPCP